VWYDKEPSVVLILSAWYPSLIAGDAIQRGLSESDKKEKQWNLTVLRMLNLMIKNISASLSIFVCLFICFESHEQFFSCLVTVTIAGDRAANLDLFLALTAFSSEGSFTCHSSCDTGPPILRSYPKDP
jgi:hypothetical protein